MRFGIRRLALVLFVGLAVSLLGPPANAQAIIKVNDAVSFRLGIQLQAWGDWQQDTTSTAGYQQNLYLRRARFLLTGSVAPDVSFFFQTDNPNLGKSTQTVAGGAGAKSLATGFIVQDAWVEWKIINEFRLTGGLYLVPLCRNCLQSTTSFLTLDISPLATLENGVTQSSGTRDTGFGAKGFFLGDHLEYRASVFSGERQPGVKNAFRYAGRLQYDVFDTETGYTYAGTNLGKRRILAFGAGSDNQGDYHAYSGDAFFDFPVLGSDAVGGQAAWYHYDGQTRFPTLQQQNDYLFELGYYFSKLKFQPFGQYEIQRFSQDANKPKNTDRWQAGFNYYIWGQNLKITPAFTRLFPNDPNVPATSEFTVQIQLFYY